MHVSRILTNKPKGIPRSEERQACERYVAGRILRAEGLGRNLATHPISLSSRELACRVFKTENPSQSQISTAKNTLERCKKQNNGVRREGKLSPESATCREYVENLLQEARKRGEKPKEKPIVLSRKQLACLAFNEKKPSKTQLLTADWTLEWCKNLGNGIRPMTKEEFAREKGSPLFKICWRYIERLLRKARKEGRDLEKEPLVFSSRELACHVFKTENPSQKEIKAIRNALERCKRTRNGIRWMGPSESRLQRGAVSKALLSFVDEHLYTVYLKKGLPLPTSYGDLAKTLFGPQPSTQQFKAAKRALRMAYESVNGQNEKPVNRKWLNTNPSQGSILTEQKATSDLSAEDVFTQNEVRERLLKALEKLGHHNPELSQRLSNYLKTGDPEVLASLSDTEKALFSARWQGARSMAI